MFVFFFVSGFLFNKEKAAANYEQYCEKRALRLMGPYVVFSAINYYINASLFGATPEELCFNLVHANLAFGAIWFLPALFFRDTIAGYILVKSRNNLVAVLLGFLSAAAGLLLNGRFEIGYLRLPQGLLGALFFVLGYIYKKYEASMFPKYKGAVGCVLMLLGFVAYRFNNLVHLSEMRFGIPPLTLISALCTIIGLLCVCQSIRMESNLLGRFVIFMGKNSMTVLCTHVYVFYFTALLYSATYIQRYGVWSPENMVILLLAMVTQVIIVLLWNSIKKACRRHKTDS